MTAPRPDTANTTDWPKRLRELVYTQFQNTNWAVPVAEAIGAQRQILQNVLEACALLWSIDPVVEDSDTTHAAYGVGRGLQLDKIGRLVGQPRGGAPDDSYRPLLRARVAANRSSGPSDQVINVFFSMFDGEGAPLLIPGWIAQYVLRLYDVVMDPLIVLAAVDLLRSATQAGTRAVLEWHTVEAAEQATCDDLSETAIDTPCATGCSDTSDPSVGGKLSGAAST